MQIIITTQYSKNIKLTYIVENVDPNADLEKVVHAAITEHCCTTDFDVFAANYLGEGKWLIEQKYTRCQPAEPVVV